MPIPTSLPSGFLNKVPKVPTPDVSSWPTPPLQGLVPPSVNPPNQCSEHPGCDCLCHEEIKYPDSCECKTMCENFFQPTSEAIGKVGAGLDILEDSAAQLDDLLGTITGGVSAIALRNPITLPTLDFTDDVMDKLTSVTSPYTDPVSRITEIINGAGVPKSCGWLSCAFGALKEALDIGPIPDITEVGFDAVKDAVKGVEDEINGAMDIANSKLLEGQKLVADAALDKMTDLGLDQVGVITQQMDKAFDTVGLTKDIRDGIGDFNQCILQSCNRTGCSYRKKFEGFVKGPKLELEAKILDPLSDLTEDVAGKVTAVLGMKRDINTMIDNGISDTIAQVMPDPILDCGPGHCRYCGPTCTSGHSEIEETEDRPQMSEDQPTPSEGLEGESAGAPDESSYPSRTEETLTPDIPEPEEIFPEVPDFGEIKTDLTSKASSAASKTSSYIKSLVGKAKPPSFKLPFGS